MNKVVTFAFSTFFACSIFATNKVSFVIKAVEKSSGQSIDTIDQAVAWLQKSKDAKQISLLGLCYYNGLGVQKDLAKAYSLFEQAAKGNDSLGLYYAGLCNLKGLGTRYTASKAYRGVEYLEKAASLGNTDAMVLLARV
jgi:TPR repeat protein